MKKFAVIALAVSALFTFTACNGSNSTTNVQPNNSVETEVTDNNVALTPANTINVVAPEDAVIYENVAAPEDVVAPENVDVTMNDTVVNAGNDVVNGEVESETVAE